MGSQPRARVEDAVIKGIVDSERRNWYDRVLPHGAPVPTFADIRRHTDEFNKYLLQKRIDVPLLPVIGFRIAAVQNLLQMAKVRVSPEEAKKLNDEAFTAIEAYKQAIVQDLHSNPYQICERSHPGTEGGISEFFNRLPRHFAKEDVDKARSNLNTVAENLFKRVRSSK